MRRTASAVLLFGCGALACFDCGAGLFANAAIVTLVAVGVAAGELRHGRLRGDAPSAVMSSATPKISLEVELHRLNALLNQSPAPLLVLEEGGTLWAVNKAAREMFAADKRITRPPAELIKLVRAHHPGSRPVLRLPPQAGKRVERSYAVSVGVSTLGETVSYIVVLTDVEAELVATEARALRELLQVLQHEIMNSLTPVISLAESACSLLATGSASDTPLVADALETIQRRAKGLDRFVQAYRSLVRLPSPSMRAIAVSRVLRDAVMLFEARWTRYGVVLTAEEPPEDVIARLDPELITQALLILLTNAAEAALAARTRLPRVKLSGVATAGSVVFRVVDSGDGVPIGLEDHIFQPFVTYKPDGAGIGLGIARQIVALHGGTLQLETPLPNQGASFLISLADCTAT